MPTTLSVSLCNHKSLVGRALTGPGSRLRVVQSPGRLTRQQVLRPTAFGGAMLAAGSSSAGLVINAASLIAWTSAAFLAGRLLLSQQTQPEDDGLRSECETCGGTGYVDCWCSRWSDGDRGCSTCRGSGRTVCSSCRGGGTAVPIEARIVIRPKERSSNFRQFKRA